MNKDKTQNVKRKPDPFDIEIEGSGVPEVKKKHDTWKYLEFFLPASMSSRRTKIKVRSNISQASVNERFVAWVIKNGGCVGEEGDLKWLEIRDAEADRFYRDTRGAAHCEDVSETIKLDGELILECSACGQRLTLTPEYFELTEHGADGPERGMGHEYMWDFHSGEVTMDGCDECVDCKTFVSVAVYEYPDGVINNVVSTVMDGPFNAVDGPLKVVQPLDAFYES